MQIHPVTFSFEFDSGDPVTLPLYSFSVRGMRCPTDHSPMACPILCRPRVQVFDVGNEEYLWAAAEHDTYFCGGCETSCCGAGNETDHLQGPTSHSPDGMTASGLRWDADPDVTSVDDVTDPLSMTDEQQSNSVRFIYSDRSSFTLGFGRSSSGGNRQQFAGETNVGALI